MVNRKIPVLYFSQFQNLKSSIITVCSVFANFFNSAIILLFCSFSIYRSPFYPYRAFRWLRTHIVNYSKPLLKKVYFFSTHESVGAKYISQKEVVCILEAALKKA